MVKIKLCRTVCRYPLQQGLNLSIAKLDSKKINNTKYLHTKIIGILWGLANWSTTEMCSIIDILKIFKNFSKLETEQSDTLLNNKIN